MEWITVEHSNKHPQKSFVTFKPKLNRVYFSKKLLHNYFNDYQYVIFRVAKESQVISFQPIAEKNDMTFKLIMARKGDVINGADVSCKEMFKYDFMPKKTTRFIAEWKPKIEWLIINFNGGDNNVK